MAQYGHNWYGTAYYGKTNAFSGWYETREIYTDEPLKATMQLRVRATLPSASYAAQDKEVTQVAGTWKYDTNLGKLVTYSTNAQLLLKATCDNVVIRYEQRTIAAKMNIEVTTTPPGGTPVVTTHVLNTQSTSVNANASFLIPGLSFGLQEVRITMATDSPVDAGFHFKGFRGRTADITLESKAGVTTGALGAYATLPATITHVSGSLYDVVAESPSYADMSWVQVKLYLASSDNATSPEVDYVELSAGDTSNRTESGTWSAVFNMEEIASSVGVSFAEVEKVTWSETVPETTELNVRSQSALRNMAADWSVEKKTVPYRQGVNRIRLKPGFNKGWVDTPFNAPAWRSYVSTVQWEQWDDQSFLPPDSAGTSVVYDFISVQKDNAANPYIRISNPMHQAERNLRGTRLRNFDHTIRIHLNRTAGKQTPVVDYVHLDSLMRYEQDIALNNIEFSAVDFDNTGTGVVLDTKTLSSQFKIPAETANPVYELIDLTGRPQELSLYFDSERQEAIRSNRTQNLQNKIWVEAKEAKLPRHFQYGGGQVSFPLKEEVRMAPTFTPQLKNGMRYRYYVENGWPTLTYRVQEGQDLQTIAALNGLTEAQLAAANPAPARNSDGSLLVGQNLTLPNDSVNGDVRVYWKSNLTNATSKSSHNAAIDGTSNVESDVVVAEVEEASTYGWVDWVSEEKIYDGVVNLNDIRGDYKRTHLSPDGQSSAQIEYQSVPGDTYVSIAKRFGVHAADIQRLNGVPVEQTAPVEGAVVQVPTRIVLPALHPKAVVSENPYQLDIIYNSVKKTDGQVLPTSVMSLHPIEITYKQVQRTGVEITRGTVPNGKDLLPEARVISIQRVDKGIVQYAKDLEYTLDGNHINWSGSGAEPAVDEVYTVNYTVEVPEKVTVRIDTSYQEEGGVDRIWRSPEVKAFSGMCRPGVDHVVALPEFNDWEGLPSNQVEDIQYIVEDNDIWVKTWVEKRGGQWYLIGSLQDRVPKDNWFPTIESGYYYLGKDEYFLFSEPMEIEPGEREMPIAENVTFAPGKFENAAKVQEGSQNLLRNSGFEVTSHGQTSFKLTF